MRFCLVVLLCVGILWMASGAANWHTPVNYEQILGQLTLATSFVLISLAFLKFFNDVFVQVRSIAGMFMAYTIVLLVAGGLHLARYLSNTETNGFWQLPYLRYIDVETTWLMLFLTILLGLPLFWMERQIFSVRAQMAATEIAQFSNLGFRIRPHFLFNSLNSVAHLISKHPARAEKALYNLADVFRVVMADKRELVPLKAELELADKYLFLEKTRLGERLQVTSRIDPDSLGVMVPVLLLQPLLENAVYHGIETRFKGGTISLSVQVVSKQLLIQISNPLPEGSMKRGSGNKVAQENLRERIYRTFGSDGIFDAHEADDRYTITLRLPL